MMLKVFADRGGTFTDLVVITDDPKIIDRLSTSPERFQVTPLTNRSWIIIYKLLSEQPEQYQDAVIQGIRDILGLLNDQAIPPGTVEVVKMGTTVATNALLERKGERTLLLMTQGFRDALAIGYQNRPNIFARQIVLPERVYERVIEVQERYTAQGEERVAITSEEEMRLVDLLKQAYQDGIRAVAIALLPLPETRTTDCYPCS
jgi:5-oxoprolinase (ATP-hydrolysing)